MNTYWRNFFLGLALYPVWKWLHQTLCPHERACFFETKCCDCGKEMKQHGHS